ncbi:hypothetical protein ACJX0J_024782, partial [Zea mays]
MLPAGRPVHCNTERFPKESWTRTTHGGGWGRSSSCCWVENGARRRAIFSKE